jgi:hypothetical protein
MNLNYLLINYSNNILTKIIILFLFKFWIYNLYLFATKFLLINWINFIFIFKFYIYLYF